MSEEARRKAGIIKTLPRSVQEAWKMLRQDTLLVNELGEDFVKKYIAVKEVMSLLSQWLIFSLRRSLLEIGMKRRGRSG